MNVAGYTRAGYIGKGKRKRRSASRNRQVLAIKEWCKQNNAQIQWFEEPKHRSSKYPLKRPSFQKLFEASKKGKFKVILAESFDLLFYNSYREALFFCWELHDAGVGVVTLDNMVDTRTTPGLVLFGCLVLNKYWYSSFISQRTIEAQAVTNRKIGRPKKRYYKKRVKSTNPWDEEVIIE